MTNNKYHFLHKFRRVSTSKRRAGGNQRTGRFTTWRTRGHVFGSPAQSAYLTSACRPHLPVPGPDHLCPGPAEPRAPHLQGHHVRCSPRRSSRPTGQCRRRRRAAAPDGAASAATVFIAPGQNSAGRHAVERTTRTIKTPRPEHRTRRKCAAAARTGAERRAVCRARAPTRTARRRWRDRARARCQRLQFGGEDVGVAPECVGGSQSVGGGNGMQARPPGGTATHYEQETAATTVTASRVDECCS